MAKENPCNNCSKRITTGVRVITHKSGEVSRQYNFTCEGYNTPLFNIMPTTHCIKQKVIPQLTNSNN